MAEKITPSHLSRRAVIYVRQSTLEQVASNLESQRRQYALAERAIELGWKRSDVVVIDDDLGVSGSGVARSGFDRLVAEVGLGQVGLVLAIEVSRLARNNRDWYHLLDLCALVDTLIGDGDGLYHPGVFNDRLLLGLKGTMSEVELHLIRSRLVGGLWEAHGVASFALICRLAMRTTAMERSSSLRTKRFVRRSHWCSPSLPSSAPRVR